MPNDYVSEADVEYNVETYGFTEELTEENF